jgi:hypothetical protein
MRNRHAHGAPDSLLPDFAALELLGTFPHARAADGAGYAESIMLWKDRADRYWVSYPRASYRRDDGADGNQPGAVVRQWCPVAAHDVAGWGVGVDTGERCGSCGYETWHEFRGMSDGYCTKCAYHG